MTKYSVMIAFNLLFTASFSQSHEAQQLLLNYEKLKQLEEILDNMYKGYEVLSQGYRKIKDVAEGNFKLHEVFLEGLYAVSPMVRDYKRVPHIVEYQLFLVKAYKRAFQRFKNDPNLTPSEVQYIASVYASLVKQSLKNIEELSMIITASKLRMNDDERLAAIDRIYQDMESKVAFLQYFNSSTQLLAMQRAKERGDVTTLQKLYGVTD